MSPRNMMRASTLSAQTGLATELVDWYRDTTCVPYVHLLIDLSPRTEDLLRYCTNTGSIPSKFYIPAQLKRSKFLDDKHTNTLYAYSPSVAIFFPQMQKSSLSVLPKKVYHVPVRM